MTLTQADLTGNPLRHYRAFRRDPIAFLSGTRALADVVRVPGVSGKTSYILHHPDMIRSLLAGDETSVVKGEAAKVLGLTVGEGLLTSEGDLHALDRRQLQPAFGTSMVTEVSATILQLTDRRMARWHDGQRMSITQELMDLTLDIVYEGLFGLEVGADRAALHSVIETSIAYSAARLMQSLPLPYWVPTPATRRHKGAVQRLDDVIDRVIDHGRSAGACPTVLRHILGLVDANGRPASRRALRDQLVTLLIAGHETSANLLGWIIVALARRPQLQDALRAEVDAVLGGEFDVSALRDLTLLRQTVRETLRLYPPAWSILRQTTVPLSVAGVTLRPHATLIIVPYALHRDERWFPDPQEFRPQRFDPQQEPTWPPFAYIPFGAGSRICIGNRLAQTETVLIVARLLQQGWWTLDLPVGEPEPSVSLRVRGGLTGKFVRTTSLGHSAGYGSRR